MRNLRQLPRLYWKDADFFGWAFSPSPPKKFNFSKNGFVKFANPHFDAYLCAVSDDCLRFFQVSHLVIKLILFISVSKPFLEKLTYFDCILLQLTHLCCLIKTFRYFEWHIFRMCESGSVKKQSPRPKNMCLHNINPN